MAMKGIESHWWRATIFRTKLLFVFCICASIAKAQTPQRPNIIFIVVDDLGYGDLSCYGHDSIRTPCIDGLAKAGMRFTQSYSGSPVCTPSRTAFMTGRYPARTPVGLIEPIDFGDDSIGLTPEFPSVATLLKQQGYKTVLVGKWHLGFGGKYSPRENGFDEFFGYTSGAIDYVSHTDPYGTRDLFLNDEAVDQEGYMTDLLSNYAIQFLEQKQSTPFFLSLQFSAPHWPWQAPGASPYPLGDDEWKRWGSKDVYRHMVENLDANVGRILNVLKQQNLSENTLIVFTSDNGGERYSDMGGLRGRKLQLWEGGIRVPSIVVWPEKVKAGSVSAQPIITMDWTATFLSVAGAKPDAKFPLDGIDLTSLLRNSEAIKQRTFYWRVFQRSQQNAVRDGDWKYLRTEEDEFLFDLKADPFETSNLKGSNRQKFNELKERFAAWESTVLPPIPLPK